MSERSIRGGIWGRIADQLSPLRLSILMAAAVAAIGCLLALSLYKSFEDTRRSAEQNAANIAKALAQDVLRLVTSLDLSLQAAADGWSRPEVRSLPVELRNMVLFDRSATMSEAGAVLLTDRHGEIVSDSHSPDPPPVNVESRDFFTVHRDRADAGLFVSMPVFSRIRKEWMLVMSRRLEDPEGRFDGVTAASIRLSYLKRLYENLELGRNGALSLVSSSGRVILRFPELPERTGQVIGDDRLLSYVRNAEAGILRTTSVFDGQDRLVAHHRIGKLPLIQNVALSWSAIFADWWARTAIIVAVFAVLALGLAGLTAITVFELGRRRKAEAELSLLARTDPLTGLGNRRAFDEALVHEWCRALAPRHSTALLILDIDHFKRYNDGNGHQAGDAALVRAGACIRSCLTRPADSAARYGGEEFAILLPNSSRQRAIATAKRIQAALAEAAIAHGGSPFAHLTASIGVAAGTVRSLSSEADLVREADEALYRAKARGRNRIEVAPMPGPEASAPAEARAEAA